ncbi:hypothetical protein D3C81_2253690 [compost metagenome]
MQHQFATFDRMAQVLLQHAPVMHSAVHTGVERTEATAPFCLGAIERRIRIGKQCRGIGAILRKHRDSDAEAHPK